MQRIRAGYCLVPNPFNPKQIRRVSLAPDEVDTIVFWTKNAAPILPHLMELDEGGYRYYFQYTINGYGQMLEPNVPRLSDAVATFCELSQRIGSEKVIWRYDPILLGNHLSPAYHIARFEEMARMLEGATHRVVVSLVTFYRKTKRRLSNLARTGLDFEPVNGDEAHIRELLREMAEIASSRGMQVYTCATERDYQDIGIMHGRCIDNELISRLFGIDCSYGKDPGQRKACGCVVSQDIGVVDTCLHGCLYCYATRDETVALRRYAEHDSQADMMWSPRS